jgi:hypothetical protein
MVWPFLRDSIAMVYILPLSVAAHAHVRLPRSLFSLAPHRQCRRVLERPERSEPIAQYDGPRPRSRGARAKLKWPNPLAKRRPPCPACTFGYIPPESARLNGNTFPAGSLPFAAARRCADHASSAARFSSAQSCL